VFVTRFTLSPDGTRVAGIKQVYQNDTLTTSLAVVDLQSGEMTEFTPAQEPHQVAWADGDTLYYSSRAATGDLLAPLTAEHRQVFDTATGGVGTELSTWQVSINTFDLASSAEQTVFSGDAYEVGRMSLADDGSLWFSLVPNMGPWVDAIVNGTFDPTTGDARDLLPISVVRFSDGAAALAGEDLSQFVLQPSAQ
jgi:dipeptidyl aminopeptidase/acylaminoacyl peptidase